jgi:hypothetical protein
MSDYRLIVTGVLVACGLAPRAVTWPVLDAVLCVLLLTAATVLAVGYVIREAVRELRFRREMRALDAVPVPQPEVLA